MGRTSNFPTNLDAFVKPNTGETVKADDMARVMDAIEKMQAKGGVDSSTTTTSLDYAVQRLQEIGGPTINAKLFGLSTSNTAAANTSALQSALNFGIFGPLVVYVPPGTYDVNELTISYSDVTLAGAGRGSSYLNYKGSTAGHAAITIAGTEDGSYGGRILEARIRDINIINGGNSDSIGISLFAVGHANFDNIGLQAFRRNALKAVNYADSVITNSTFDFCGSTDDSNKSVIDFSDSGSIEWGVDAIRFLNCRFENFSDRVVRLQGGTYYVNKIYFIGCKFESSTTDGNGLSGNASTFLLSLTNQIFFTNCDFTCQGLKNGTHTIIPAMFTINGSNGVTFTGCTWSMGAVGPIKPYTSLFDCNGSSATNYALLWINCVFTTGNAASPPTQVWKWTGTNNKVGRKNVTWGFVAGGGSPTADSGTPSSASDF